jgi:hypothetical protein
MHTERHLLAWILPLAAAVSIYHHFLAFPRELPDEAQYTCAGRAVSRGESPYVCERYFYPPLLAQLEAAATAHVPQLYASELLRALELLGAVWIVAFSTARLPAPPWARAALGVLVVAWSKGVDDSLRYGNISPIIVALTLWALSRWPHKPLRAGLALGVGVALKPMAPLAVLLLAVHRPRAPARARRQLMAAGAAAITAGVLTWPGRAQLPGLLQQGFRQQASTHNVSCQRLAQLLGVSLPPLWVAGAVAIAAVIYARRRELSAAALLDVACAAALLAQPVIWPHTLLLAYPLLAAAAARVLRDTPPPGPESPRMPMLLGTSWAALCVLHSEMFGDLGQYSPRLIAALLTVVPLALVLALARYAHAGEERVSGEHVAVSTRPGPC